MCISIDQLKPRQVLPDESQGIEVVARLYASAARTTFLSLKNHRLPHHLRSQQYSGTMLELFSPGAQDRNIREILHIENTVNVQRLHYVRVA